jgi:primary-amine oxidase
MVLYRGSLAELFVPYMDADPGWAFRAWLDVGESDFGFMASPLSPGIDCPAGAAFLDAVLADSHGEPRAGKSVICLFERDTGAPLWRHAEGVNASYAGRPAVELVLRTIESIGNYDYIIDWVLTEAGVIRIEVGATGIDSVKGVTARNMADPAAAKDTQTGMLVAPNLVAVNHDHFLSFRLDVDIDGAANTLVRQRLVPQPAAEMAAGRSLWRVVEENVATEGPLSAGEHGGADAWRIVNPTLENRLGQHPGYELRPGHSAISLLPPEDPAQRRGAFAAAPLWVTAYDAKELYAAGMYPNQRSSRRGTGRSTTPTSCCGPRSASTTCRGPRTGRSCRRCGTACRWCPTDSSTRTRASLLRTRRRRTPLEDEPRATRSASAHSSHTAKIHWIE